MALRNTYFESNKVYEPLPIPDQPGYDPPTPPIPPTPSSGSIPDIPRPAHSGSVECILYINSSENNALDKNISVVTSDSLVIKDDVDMINPSILYSSSNDLSNVNYMRFNGKYYFVRSIESIPGNIWKINGHVDVLMTYKEDIRNQIAIVGRNSNQYNRYLNDDRIKTVAYEQVKTLQFPSGFSKTMQYYLIAIGGINSNNT